MGGLAEALQSVAEQADGVPQQGAEEGRRESAALATFEIFFELWVDMVMVF